MPRFSEQLLDLSHVGSSVPGGIELLNRAALRGGKQFRSRLLLTLSRALKVPDESAFPYAIAAERVHNATLLHDDVIDEADSRRGGPSFNAAQGNRKAVLVGDLLLARTLVDLGGLEHPEALRDLFQVLVSLMEGEWLQLEARGNLDVSERHLMRVARDKTGSLIAWCCRTPGRLAGLDDLSVKSLGEFGERVGLAFQLLDDCMDYDPESGKPFGQDLREGQVNFLVLQALEALPTLRQEIKECLNQASPAPLSQDLKNALRRAAADLGRRVEAECEAARVALKMSDFSGSVCSVLEAEIIAPLLKRMRDVMRRIDGALS